VYRPLSDATARKGADFDLVNPLNTEILVFLHIPKTAGTSFKHRLLAEYGAERVALVYKTDDRAAGLRDALHQKPYAISGHLSMADVEVAMSSTAFPLALYTFIRDPQSQVISHFLHRVRDRNLPPTERLRAFESFLDEPRGRNVQSLLLSGLPRSAWPEAEPERIWNGVLERLPRFRCLGTTEQYDKSLSVIRTQQHWARRKPEHRNPMRQSDWVAELRMRYAERIAEQNLLDTALHTRATATLNEAFAALSPWRRWFG